MEHHFNTTIASKFDVNTAIFIDHLKYWTLLNLANKKNIINGFCWSYNSLEALSDIFPYWSKRQLETVIKNAISSGLVIKGNHNKSSYDRTCWYALTYAAYEFYPHLKEEKYLKRLYNSISPKCEMGFPEWGNLNHNYVTPIPDTKPDTKPYNPNPLPLAKVKKQKITFSTEDMKQANPHQIPYDHLEEWQSIRKKPITARVWAKTNEVMGKLALDGIPAIEAFELMLEKQWAGMEYRYFEQEIKFRKTGTTIAPSFQSKPKNKFNMEKVRNA